MVAAEVEDELIGVVHLSGEVKVWHRILAATSSKSEDRCRESRLDHHEW